MALHVDPWLNKGTCPSYFLKWMDALCFAPPYFSSLRPNICVPFHAVIMICDFRVKLSTNVLYTFTFVHSKADPEGGGDLPMDGL